MDRRKMILGKRVNASSVLEVVISMVIIIVVFDIAMMIYTNITRQSLSGQKIKAQAVLGSMLKYIDGSNSNSYQQSVVDGFTIERSVKHYAGNDKLLEVDLKAYDGNHLLLAELNQLLIQENSDQ